MTGLARPSGTVTFLFTDIEGSTRLWDEHPQVMRSALARHDEILRTVIDAHRGVVFSTGGDGVAAAFHRAADAVTAAVEAQRRLGDEPWPAPLRLRVRMGLHTGEAQERDGDYFGPPLNRAARVMAAGHGGQILLSGATAGIATGIELSDLGERRLRDLSGVEHLFQVRAEGLTSEFAPLRTMDEVPGNLPVQVTSFVGRDVEVKELTELVRAHRLVTLTGVGGVGKTRLAVQVAAELVTEFPDGVWLVELAPVGDPASVPDAVATVLGVTAQADRGTTDGIAAALSGRRLLLLLDNCEHVLDAAADLAETILTHTATVKVIATSREGLRVGAEHLWPVPSLDVEAGTASAAVELFVERAEAVSPGFRLGEPPEAEAVTAICRRLDGIALAIELAAARMVSMNPAEVLERLTDRFRLLSGSRRGLERHQTLRHAVQWSYDLLSDDERSTLDRCSVFAGGFDLAAATYLCLDAGLDEYMVLDLLDSLVRKSLVSAEQVSGHTRYGLLETIRQFTEDRLATSGDVDRLRDRHASYFAEQAGAHWLMWDGPRQRVAADWTDAELANLRTGFRWAADQGDLAWAAAIAAHTSLMAGFSLQRYEPAGWAEEILAAATTADIPQLPRLYVAASLCVVTGGVETGLDYAQTAIALEADPRYDAFDVGWSGLCHAAGHYFAGRVDRALDVYTDLAAQPGLPHVVGLCGLLSFLNLAGRAEEAWAMADEAVTAARSRGNPFMLAFTLAGYGKAYAEVDPARALSASREGLACAEEHRVELYEQVLAAQAAALEAVLGDLEHSLPHFDFAIDSMYVAGNVGHLAIVLARLAAAFDRIERPEIAAIIYGTCTRYPTIAMVAELPSVVEHLQTELGATRFDSCVAVGAAMELAEAARYARQQIELVRRELVESA